MSYTTEELRTRARLEEHGIRNVHTTTFPGTFNGHDDSWNYDNFVKNLKVNILKIDAEEIIFELIGVDAAIANAFRRILIAELPTMAIEKVLVMNNTSIIQEEILAHRVGLIPLKADPRIFQDKTSTLEEPAASDTLVYEVKIACKKNPKAPVGSTNPDELYINHSVYSRDIKWVPIGNQAEYLREENVRPVNGNILIAKLTPGQEIDITMHAVKGIGKDHAKFSPVATASYRMRPEIILKKPLYNEDAERFQSCFSKGTIELRKDELGRKYPVVVRPWNDMCCREIFKHEDLKDSVIINKIRDHFIFSIETTGALPPEVLFQEAVKLLIAKCREVKNAIKAAKSQKIAVVIHLAHFIL